MKAGDFVSLQEIFEKKWSLFSDVGDIWIFQRREKIMRWSKSSQKVTSIWTNEKRYV